MSKYDDIINLPHHQSKVRPHMSVSDRAAQFAPFAALTGYGDAIRETERLTDKKIELSESQIAELDLRLGELLARIDEKPKVTITYFIADERKAGGRYVTCSGELCKFDEYNRVLFLGDGTKIALEDIIEIK